MNTSVCLQFCKLQCNVRILIKLQCDYSLTPNQESIVNYYYTFRLKWVCDKIEDHAKEHEKFTDQVLDEQTDRGKDALGEDIIEKHVQTLNKRADENYEAIEHRDQILDEAKTIAQFETFLETAPQTILQLYIFFQIDDVDEITLLQWITLIKSFSFFLMGAMTNYLGPTKVSF